MSSIELGDTPIIGASDAFGDSRLSLRREIGARVTPCEPGFLLPAERRSSPSGASLCLVECRVEDAITGARDAGHDIWRLQRGAAIAGSRKPGGQAPSSRRKTPRRLMEEEAVARPMEAVVRPGAVEQMVG